MAQKCIFFDLDGTLTDSGEGIMNCVSQTLTYYGLPVPDRQDLRFVIGPPLKTTFPKLGIPEDQVAEAIQTYRKFYVPKGMFENYPYPGIETLLQKLKDQGHRLFVATSKPEHMSIAILEHFSLAGYFEKICGSAMDGVRDKKSEVIAYLLDAIGGTHEAVMVGDTVFDVLGAAEHNIPTIGVSWGYGQVLQMRNAGAIAIADTMDELFKLLNQ